MEIKREGGPGEAASGPACQGLVTSRNLFSSLSGDALIRHNVRVEISALLGTVDEVLASPGRSHKTSCG